MYFKNVHVFIRHYYLLRKHHHSQRMQFSTPLVHLSSFACALIVNRKQGRFLCTVEFIVITMSFLNLISVPTVKDFRASKILYQTI